MNSPKKSGLADSPFFRPLEPTPLPQAEVMSPPPVEPPQTLYASPERSVVQMNERSPVQTFTRTDEQPNKRTAERLNKRTVERPARHTFRQSYDIFQDQALAIEDLCLKWSRERGKHITKGQVVRELLDEILAKKK